MSQISKNLGVLGGVSVGAVALGLYAYFGVMKGDEKEAKAKEVSAQVFAAATAEGPSAPSAFKKLTVTASGQTTVLVHDAKGWSLTSPVEAPADADAVEGIVSSLTHDTFKQTVEEHPTQADLKKYGLDTPRFQLTAVFQKAKGAPQTFTLKGGIENPFDGSVYVQRDGEETVHAINGAFKAALERSTFQLRDKRLVTFEESALKGISLTGKDQAVTLALDDAQHWRLTRPLQDLADDTAVKALWTAIQTQRATAFPADTPQARVDFGLTAPTVTATFTPKDGVPVQLALAEKGTGAERHAFAQVTQGKRVTLAQIPPALLDALLPKPDALRDHTVLSFEEKKVVRVSYQAKAGEPAIELAREKTQGSALSDWKVVGPKETAAKTPAAKGWKVSSLLWTLHSLQSVGFGSAHPSDPVWRDHGLDAKARTISLFGDSDQVLATLVIGSPVKDHPDRRWVHGSKDQLLELDQAALAKLPSSIAELTDAPSASTASAAPAAAH